MEATSKDDAGAGNKPDYLPFHELDEQPKLVTGGTLKDYQLHGLSFLVWMWKNGMNCILGDEMVTHICVFNEPFSPHTYL
jgi:SWI/SNF-related matrix-associated actin-dependent regulator of chromatin subfamily A member 5